MKPTSIFSAKTFVILMSMLIPYLHIGPILAADAPKITEHSIPTSQSIPFAITSGPDGAIWFTESIGNKIGRVDPTTNAITEYKVSASNNGPAGITTGPDGALWIAEATNFIARIDPKTKAVTTYQTPLFTRQAGIASGSDGGLWFTQWLSSQVGRIDPTTHDITEYGSPVFAGAGITSGPDGALWYAGNGLGVIGRIDLSKTPPDITEYPTPTANSGPIGITTGPDGALWFTETGNFTFNNNKLNFFSGFFGANQIGRIDPTTHVITEYPVPTASSSPFGIVTGPDGALWFTEATANQIGRIDPTTHVVTEYPVPTSMSGPSGITSGPDGALWFTETAGNKIGKIVIAAAGTVTASFTANPTSGPVPLTVTFTDTSTGPPTAWSWSFGDGAKSTSQNPTHTYTKAGVFKVTLTASNSAGSSSTSQTITVSVSATAVPGAPTIVSVTPGNEQVTVNFKPPASNGGSRITKYTVSSNLGDTATGAGSPITVKKLTNGTDYTFTVTASNIDGPGPASSPVPATPATKPGDPAGVEATAGNGEATITFTPPSSDGGSAITGYSAISNPKGGADTSADTTSTTHLMTGLKNGTRYSFTVEATNAVGTTVSKPSNSVTPATVPGEPTDVKATAGKTKGTVTVSFKPPASNGGSSITGYTVESPQDGSVNVTGKSSPIIVTGLTSGSDYTFTVFATNSKGNGQPSGASNSVAAP